MIIRNGERPGYWSTGIILTWNPLVFRGDDGKWVSGWSDIVTFHDDGWVDDLDTDAGAISTEGTLRTRYAVTDGQVRTALAAVIDTLIADADRLGIRFTWPTADDRPHLYYRGDGEHPDYPPPDGWRDLLAAEAERIGWATYRAAEVKA